MWKVSGLPRFSGSESAAPITQMVLVPSSTGKNRRSRRRIRRSVRIVHWRRVSQDLLERLARQRTDRPSACPIAPGSFRKHHRLFPNPLTIVLNSADRSDRSIIAASPRGYGSGVDVAIDDLSNPVAGEPVASAGRENPGHNRLRVLHGDAADLGVGSKLVEGHGAMVNQIAGVAVAHPDQVREHRCRENLGQVCHGLDLRPLAQVSDQPVRGLAEGVRPCPSPLSVTGHGQNAPGQGVLRGIGLDYDRAGPPSDPMGTVQQAGTARRSEVGMVGEEPLGRLVLADRKNAWRMYTTGTGRAAWRRTARAQSEPLHRDRCREPECLSPG